MGKLREEKYGEALDLLKTSIEWPENIGVGKPYDVDERPQHHLIALATQRVGEVENSKAFFEKVLSYSTEKIETNSINHLYGLLAAKQLSDDVLKDLMKKLEATKPGNRTKMAMAIFNKEREVDDTFRQKSNIPDQAFEMMKWSMQNANN